MDFKCVVIDDEQHAVDAMARYIENMPNLVLASTFTSSLSALQAIHTEDELDFIFLDIEMPEISGLELAESLRSKTRFLIFTTSHSKHALAAFDLQANQYLLKPISFAKFALIVDSLLKGIIPKAAEVSKIPEKRLKFVKADHKNSYHYIDPSEIIFIQAAKNYVHIHTEKGNIMTHMGLSHIEAALSASDFIRINKSYIIAKNAIRKIEGNLIRLKNGEAFQVGETYKANFVAFIKGDMM